MVDLPFIGKTGFAPSGGGASDGGFSSTGKYFVPADGSASPTIQIWIRNDATGNYDTRVYPTGSGAVSIGAAIFSSDDNRAIIAASQGWLYWAKRTGDAFAYEGGLNTGSGALSALSGSPITPTLVATGSQNSIVRFYNLVASGAGGTQLSTRTMPTFVEDVQFSPTGNWCAAIDRNGNVDFYSVNGTTVTFVSRFTTAAGGYNLTWSPDGTHLVATINAAGLQQHVFKISGSSITKLTTPFDSPLSGASSAATFISGGKLLLIQGKTAENWKVFQRSNDNYIDVTGQVTGYTGIVANAARANVDGKWLAVIGTTVSLYQTPVLSDNDTAQGNFQLGTFSIEGALLQENNVRSNSRLPSFSLAGELRAPIGVLSSQRLRGMTATALVAAAAEDIIALRPIIMTAGASFVSGVTPNLTIDNTPDPFTYGTLEIASFTTEGLVKFPLEIADSYLQLTGFVTDGKIKFPIETGDVALVMAAFSVDGFVRTPDGQFAGEMGLEPFSAEGSVHVPSGAIGALSIEGFATEGELRFGFKIDSELLISEFTSDGIGGIVPKISGGLELPAFEATGLLMPPIKITSEMGIPPFTLDGEGRKDRRQVEAALSLSPFSSDGEIFMPFGLRADVFLKGFNASGNVKLPYAIRSEMSMPKMRAAGLFKRPDSIDANMSMKRFTHDGFIGFDLSNTAQLQLQQFVSDGELVLSMDVEGAMSMAPMEIAGELIFLNEIAGTVTLGAFTSEGEIKLEYKINSDGTMRPFELDGYLELEEPEVGGSMSLAAFTLSGSFKMLMRRRQLRIVMDTV